MIKVSGKGCRDSAADIMGTCKNFKEFAKEAKIESSPPQFLDLSRLIKRIRDQSVFGTCVGFAMARASESVLMQRSDFNEELSALQLYKQARAIRREQNDSMDGTTIDAAMHGLKAGGYLLESEYPYKPSQRFGTFKLHQGLKGLKRIGTHFYRITDMSRAEEEVKTALANSCGVVGGWLVGRAFEEWKPGDPPMNIVNGTGHAMAIHDYPDGSPRLVNSWGPDKGENGTWRVTWNFVRQARSLWVISHVPLS
jgi:C1A family cysteine protease